MEELSSIGAVLLDINYIYENIALIDWIHMLSISLITMGIPPE